jgi:hypothetical protein
MSEHETLSLHIRDTTLELNPETGTIRWLRSFSGVEPIDLVAHVEGFDQWTILEKGKQRVLVQLGAEGRTLEAYAMGVAILRNAGATLENVGDLGDAEAWPYHFNARFKWWIASPDPISVSNEELHHGGTWAVFYHTLDEPHWWASIAVSEDPDDRMVAPSTNTRLLQAFRTAFWARPERLIHEDLPRDAILLTATRGALDRWGWLLNLTRRPGEGDEEYRLRIMVEAKLRFGGDTENDIIEFFENALSAPSGSVRIVERNRDPETGDHEPARFRLQFDLELLDNIGVAPEDYTAKIEELDEFLVRLTAAGVHADVEPAVEVFWDEAAWDEDVYAP